MGVGAGCGDLQYCLDDFPLLAEPDVNGLGGLDLLFENGCFDCVASSLRLWAHPSQEGSGELAFIDPRGLVPPVYNLDLRIEGRVAVGSSTTLADACGVPLPQ